MKNIIITMLFLGVMFASFATYAEVEIPQVGMTADDAGEIKDILKQVVTKQDKLGDAVTVISNRQSALETKQTAFERSLTYDNPTTGEKGILSSIKGEIKETNKSIIKVGEKVEDGNKSEIAMIIIGVICIIIAIFVGNNSLVVALSEFTKKITPK